MPHPIIGFGLSRAVSLEHHLRSNHYPPVDIRWIPHCEQAIDLAVEGFDGESIDQDTLNADVGQGKTVGELLDGLHLWDYVEQGIEDRRASDEGDYEPKRGE